MKIPCLAALLAVIFLLVPARVSRADDAEQPEQKRWADITAASRTVFYAVLEGCFADGLTDEDVDQILRREAPNRQPLHFIYGCPICTATQEALESYRGRSDSHGKRGGKVTFGQGLTPEMHTRLYSENLKERLGAIHDLEENWVSRRVASLRLDPEELARLQARLRLARDEGTSVLQNSLRDGSVQGYASAYRQGDECALCNAAAGMKLKLATDAR